VLNQLRVLKQTHAIKGFWRVNAKINACSFSRNPSYGMIFIPSTLVILHLLGYRTALLNRSVMLPKLLMEALLEDNR
jgi:hypothetical protein